MNRHDRPEWSALGAVPGDFDGATFWSHWDGLGALAQALGGSVDSFTGHLLRLYAKADPGNRLKLTRAFPRECLAYEWWQHQDQFPSVQAVQDMLATIGPLAELVGGNVVAVSRPGDMLLYGEALYDLGQEGT